MAEYLGVASGFAIPLGIGVLNCLYSSLCGKTVSGKVPLPQSFRQFGGSGTALWAFATWSQSSLYVYREHMSAPTHKLLSIKVNLDLDIRGCHNTRRHSKTETLIHSAILFALVDKFADGEVCIHDVQDAYYSAMAYSKSLSTCQACRAYMIPVFSKCTAVIFNDAIDQVEYHAPSQ